MRQAVMTVGYQGRGADELIEGLEAAGVDMVIDVRLTPLSRKPGLSKTRLADALRQSGIDYLHMPQLGNPRDNRQAYRDAETGAVERFRLLLETPDASRAIEQLRGFALDKVIALLCFERDPAQCHRALVVEAIAAVDAEVSVRHL